MSRVYLDHNATMPLRAEAREAMLAAMDLVGNPSSVHAEGRAARALVERSRERLAEAVGCKPSEIVFTSGATEAASVLSRLSPRSAVLVDATAHDALRAHARTGDRVERPHGPGHVLAMGLASGETGIVTEPPDRVDGQWPFEEARADRLLLDVTQAVGRVPFAFGWSGADMAILSAHKLGGPKGAGALILREGVDVAPLLPGGGQETGRRSGTENVAGIAGFAAAAEAALRDLAAGAWERVAQLRDILESALEAGSPDTILVGRPSRRLPNTTLALSPGWKGETQVMAMDLAGFAVSSGSACSSGKVRASRTLRAMGYDEALAACALRVSLGPRTTEEEVLRFAEAFAAARRKQQSRAA